MKSPRLAALAMRELLLDAPILRIAAAAIVLVPLLYGALYLWAFWDPYGKLDQMPVALVNLDRPVTVDGDEIHAGADLVKTLSDGKDVGWHVVSATEAAEGLKARRYYLSLTIPSDFSARLGTAKSAKPERAELRVVAQESSNMLASQIMTRVFAEVRAGAAESASKTYIDKMFIGFSDAHDGLTEAALGAGDLRDGIATAADGARSLAKGATAADAGAASLSTGVAALGAGARKADAGATQVATGTAALASGLASARTGSRALQAGASQLASGLAAAGGGAHSVAGGTAALASGLAGAKGGAAQVAGGAAALSTGTVALAGALDQLAAGSSTLATSAATLSAGAAQLESGVGSALSQLADAQSGATQVAGGAAGVSAALHAYVAAHPEAATDANFATALGTADAVRDGSAQLASGLDAAAADAPTLATGAGQVADGASQLSAGAGQLAGGIGQADAAGGQVSAGAAALSLGASQLASGVDSAEDGATVLAAGSAQVASASDALSAGAGSLSSGATQLAAGTVSAARGARKLAAGSATLADGTHALASGADTAADGADTLSAGLATLDDGANQLSAALPSAVDGAGKLRSALTSGAGGVPDYDTAERTANDAMMSDPVSLSTVRQGIVPTYGTGFSPYFLPLALWVGALLVFFLLKPLPARAIASGADPLVCALASYLPAAVFGIAQAVVLMLVVQLGLGLKPVDVAATYGLAILTALAFVAILQMLNGALGAVGKLVSIVLLMLQLTSAGGTFPTQMIPSFFQAINPWLPMSYVVAGLRQTISGGDLAAAGTDALVVLAFGIGALAITTFAAWRKQTTTVERLHPALSL